jgi:uncharacterized membrane protein
MIPNTPDKMNVQEEQEIKKEFLLERVVLFSDAVFAIIITIMVIEIKLPAGIREATDGAVHHAFKELMFKLGGYAFTFFLVANFWIRHIRICSYLKDYNKMFLVFNLLFLFTISLFPFAVSIFTEAPNLHSTITNYGVNIYIGVVLSAILTQALLTNYIVSNKAELCLKNGGLEQTLEWKVARLSFITIPLVGTIILLFNFYHLDFIFSLYAISIIGITTALGRRIYYPKTQQH